MIQAYHSISSFLLFRLLVATIAAMLFCVAPNVGGTASDPVQEPSWTRAVTDNSELHNRPFTPFVLLVVSGRGNHTEGLAVFMNSGQAPTRLEGTESPEKDFWINVTAEVGNERDGQWNAIGKSTGKGQEVAFTIEPRATKKKIHVELDMFRPLIGRFKYGKVAIKSGEYAVFELTDLLPPK